MSHQNDKDLQRIFKTFKRLGKQIYPEDIQALKRLNDSLEFYKIEQVNDNKIFAKLLAMQLRYRYEGTKDISLALKLLQSDLSESLDFQMQLFSNTIKSTEIVEYIKTLKINVPENEFGDIEALTKREDEFWNTHQKAIFAEIKKQWSTDFVKSNFINTANEVLQTIEFSS